MWVGLLANEVDHPSLIHLFDNQPLLSYSPSFAFSRYLPSGLLVATMFSSYSLPFSSYFVQNDKAAAAAAQTSEPLQVKARDSNTYFISTTSAADPTKTSSTTFTLMACTVLTVALAAKTIRSSHRARHARHEAQAWKRVSMALIDRGYGVRASKGRTLERLEGEGEWGNELNRKKRVPGNLINIQVEEAKVAEVSHATLPKDAIKPQFTPTPSPRSSLYSPIHPHEDWDWTPADHPRPAQSWRRTKLPPWSIGITSAPKAPSSSPLQVKVKDMPKEAKAATTGEKKEDVDLDEYLLRSAVWPDSDPLGASEAAMIAEQVFKEVEDEKKWPITPIKAIKAKRILQSSVKGDSEKVQVLERQIWALLMRAQALEDKLRSKGIRF
jgi:hypothetical protein